MRATNPGRLRCGLDCRVMDAYWDTGGWGLMGLEKALGYMEMATVCADNGSRRLAESTRGRRDLWEQDAAETAGQAE